MEKRYRRMKWKKIRGLKKIQDIIFDNKNSSWKIFE